MHIAAFEAKGNRNFLITLKDRKGRELIIRVAKEIMGIFQDNIDLIARSLKVMNERLVLLHPVRLDNLRNS